ncbi:DUF6320 domain-containing protein [Acholeplasma granularum]|uniref:DUF6320 domain-containing protein n=1 Tax=Acholeplasma granularum TaxID=264635 RepID=UPI000472DCA5|nr:DUF6320 domain-containing protein [Acholeplasma granularum]
MNYCKQCNAYYFKEETSCKICGRPLITTDHESKVLTQGYPSLKVKKRKRKMVSKIFGIISLSAILITGIINLLTYDSNPTLWSLLIIGPIIYGWILLVSLILAKHEYPQKINRQILVTSTLLILIDILIGYKAWSLTYVVPALIFAATVIVPLFVASKPEKYYLHARSLLFLILLNIIVGILPFISNFMIEGVYWTGITLILSGILLLSSMFFFARKDTWTEFIKIFRL